MFYFRIVGGDLKFADTIMNGLRKPFTLPSHHPFTCMLLHICDGFHLNVLTFTSAMTLVICAALYMGTGLIENQRFTNNNQERIHLALVDFNFR